MQMVQDALDYQAQATYFDFGDNMGDQIEQEIFAPLEFFGDPLMALTQHFQEPLQQVDFGLQGRQYDHVLASSYMTPPSLPGTPPVHMQRHSSLQYHPLGQGNLQYLENPPDQYPDLFGRISVNPPANPTIWNQTRARLNHGLLHEQGQNYVPETAKF